MAKEISISVIILIILLYFNSITQNYTKSSIHELTQELQTFRQKIIDEEEEEILKEDISKIYKIWDEKKSTLAYFIEHDELEKVETELTAIKGNVEVGELEQTVTDVDKCEFILNHIEEKYELLIKNIF